MSKSKCEYKTATDTDNAVKCQSCGVVIGSYVRGADSRTLVLTGNVALYSAHGICQVCGDPWHWCFTDKTLERLVKRRRSK